ncbi:redoxin domain-containing protein [Ferrimonas balearica]|uniref:redoxin domain-containing protein n=1 Tax=Ferrimonas balearica TaxID=44012 RepID=UPI001C9A0236|nr:redoxin domain-containing protein [Ferrimonas balearica]MBY5923012.1 redoxin family protein [Ferrimonas balearica]MBY5997611.1 redoxin family protein [Ferrimonas balearica]
MDQHKLAAGDRFPELHVTTFEGDSVRLGQPRPESGANWQMVVVYRGRHCPLCTKYLNQLESFREELAGIGVDILAVSADSQAQLAEHKSRLEVGFPLAYGLTQAQMESLGVYISLPRSDQETDHNFAEPGLFVVNDAGNLHVVDLSNNPFVRPELQALVNGLRWIRDPGNHYPIRGNWRSPQSELQFQ